MCAKASRGFSHLTAKFRPECVPVRTTALCFNYRYKHQNSQKKPHTHTIMADVTTKHVTQKLWILMQTCTTISVQCLFWWNFCVYMCPDVWKLKLVLEKKRWNADFSLPQSWGDVFQMFRHTLERVRAQWSLLTKVSKIETSTIFIHITVITVQRNAKWRTACQKCCVREEKMLYTWGKIPASRRREVIMKLMERTTCMTRGKKGKSSKELRANQEFLPEMLAIEWRPEVSWLEC